MLSREHPGLAHRLRAEGAFRVPEQKHDAQFASSSSRPRDAYTA
jgi:hypothetical protein